MSRLKVLQRYCTQALRLYKEETVAETYAEIAEGAAWKGYNLWILFFAMLISCIGLITDSQSALIGAMLISPLMGPIVSYAFALAINDNKLKRTSFKNWLLMVGISLTASTLFFLFNPFDNNTSALASFQRASIFDILLAFFGGMAGFLGIIKKEGIKVLAGVAVATACMPPLCTAGFGLAHADWKFLLGGLYFFVINCLFIGLATFLLTRFSGFHAIHQSEVVLTRTNRWLWGIFIVAMLIPGFYIALQKWREEHQKSSVNSTEKRLDSLEKKIKELERKLEQRP